MSMVIHWKGDRFAGWINASYLSVKTNNSQNKAKSRIATTYCLQSLVLNKKLADMQTKDKVFPKLREERWRETSQSNWLGRAQTFYLANKNFKAAIKIMSKELKENILTMNKQGISTEMEKSKWKF